MRNLLASLTIAAFVCSVSSPVQAQFGSWFGGPKVETIDTAQLQKMLAENQTKIDEAKAADAKLPEPDFVVVDVRSDKEINVSIIPGAISKAQYEKDSAKYQDKLVIPYCTVGGRSGAYARELAGKGVNVKNYKGSILKWVDAGLPLITPEGQPTNRVHTYSDRYRIPAKYEQVTK
ncbi:molybdopterin biosynthesis protein MoeB [Rubripirellula obstinata]|uniref:Molybdopterin biosynthesis protein MoeB n=1 Tax=Rubripirellula obstinata TaxID=406547 RepID=A0A5B1CBZ8_9BACT|nr:rhodanese-like domain-containing protein [Rubripirellula obstinata]KAA1258698.1 molybdopterin biosynthesis protein MoeB [Rubripirellula obstinata]